MKRFLIPTFLILTLILAACSAISIPLPPSTAAQDDPQPVPVSTDSSSPSNDSATRTDQQGAVVMEVIPLNLGAPADTLDFDITMNTHSVDLSMDLATLATLTTDTGVTVQATTGTRRAADITSAVN